MGVGNFKSGPVAIVVLGAVALLTSVAGAAPAAVDLQLDILVVQGTVATVVNPGAHLIPNGGTVTVQGRNVVTGPVLGLINPEAAAAKVRFQLPEGLNWGADGPDPVESCISTPSTAECQSPSLQPITGQTDWGWAWDVVAAQPGTYVIRAEILEASPPDVQTANNTSSVTVVVTEATGGGGGGAAVSAGAVKLSPAKPKAGSTVRATVRVMLDGAPVRPSAISCRGAIGTSKITGTGKAASGTATCIYRTPKAAKGKTLRGTMSFRARDKSFTRRFAAKLG